MGMITSSTMVPLVQLPEQYPCTSSPSCPMLSVWRTLAQLSLQGGLKLMQLAPRPIPRHSPPEVLVPPLPQSILGMGFLALRSENVRF
jgi:hypothetical protein